MINSIQIFEELVKKYFPSSDLLNEISENQSFSSQLLFDLIDFGVENINRQLKEKEISEELSNDFLNELLFDLASSFDENKDETIQHLIAQNNLQFKENLAFINDSRLAIVKLERENLKNRFNELDNKLELTDKEIENSIKIIERKSIKASLNKLDEITVNQAVKIFKLSTVLKYAAIFLIIPFSIIAIYITNRMNQVTIANNHNSKREIPVVKDSTRIIKNENEINFSMPIAKTISFKVSPIGEASFGYASTNKEVKVNVVNLSEQIKKMNVDCKSLRFKFSKQELELTKIDNYYNSKIDSIVKLDKNFTFNEKESILTLFMIDKFEIDKVSIFNKNETLKNSILKLNGRYFELKSIKNTTALKEIRDVEIIDYCESLE